MQSIEVRIEGVNLFLKRGDVRIDLSKFSVEVSIDCHPYEQVGGKRTPSP